MSDAVLKANGLSKTYPSGDQTLGVLSGVDLAVVAGESVSIRGESGSGKSTLLNLLAGLDRPDAGELFWGGEAAHQLSLGELTARRGRFLGMVFQAYYLIPEIDALANVLMGARLVGRVGPKETRQGAAQTGGTGGARTSSAGATFRRRTPASGCGPRVDEPPAGHPRRRTHREPRRTHRRRSHRAAAGGLCRGKRGLGAGDAQSRSRAPDRPTVLVAQRPLATGAVKVMPRFSL